MKQNELTKTPKKKTFKKILKTNLAVRPHHRGQQLPRPAPAVHPDHPEDLQEAEEPHAGGDEHVVGRPQPDHDQRRPDHYYVCEGGGKMSTYTIEIINAYL